MYPIARMRRSGWDPTKDFSQLQDEINRLFNTEGPNGMTGLFDRHISPSLDVVEKDNSIVVHVDLPGVSKDEVELSIANSVLTIKGEKKKEEEKEESKNYRDETWSGTFQRTISLPEIVDPNNVEATMKNGVLTVSLAKKEEKKPKQIEVKVK